jgi:plasmid replication initiation protein
VAFLQINQEIASILKLSELGNIDFEKLLNDFTKVPANFNKDNLKADVENLYKTVPTLLRRYNHLGNALLQSSQFNQLFQWEDEFSYDYSPELRQSL